jgi:hypothetical protein
MPWLDFVTRLRCSILTLEDKKISPDLIYEAIPKKEREEDTVGMEYYANADDMKSRSAQQYQMTPSDLRQYDESTAQNARDAARLCGVRPRDHDNRIIPEGHKLAHVGTTAGRTDVVGIMRSVQQLVCATLGVPRTMLINDSVARADTTATHARFRATLKQYRRHMEHVLTVAFNAMEPRTQYIVAKLPDVFYGPPETLAQMWLLGVIDFNTYTRTIARTYGLTPRITPPLFDTAQKAEIAAECMRNIITQHHGRT